MPAARKKKNNNKKSPQTAFKSNNVEPPLSEEYKAAWQLEYEKLSKEQKAIIDNAKNDPNYKRDWFVDGFVKRVIGLVENPPEDKAE
jgi:hypothetical protein